MPLILSHIDGLLLTQMRFLCNSFTSHSVLWSHIASTISSCTSATENSFLTVECWCILGVKAKTLINEARQFTATMIGAVPEGRHQF